MMRFGTWALGGPVDAVRGALRRSDARFWVFGGGLRAKRAAFGLGEALEVVRGTLEVNFNTTSAAEAKARGADGDSGLRQLSMDAGCLAQLGLVPGLRAGLAAMAGACSFLAHLCWIPYCSCSPVLLFAEPGSGEQVAYIDAARVPLVDTGAPRVHEGLLAMQANTQLRTWPGVQLTPVVGSGGEGEEGKGARPEGAGQDVEKRRAGKRTRGRKKALEALLETEATCAASEDDCIVLHVPEGCCVFFRGDAVHAGSGNPSSGCHWRMHPYLLSEGLTELDLLEDTTLISW